MEYHYHLSWEHIAIFGFAAMLVRFLWLQFAALLATNDGPIGQLGLAMGGFAH